MVKRNWFVFMLVILCGLSWYKVVHDYKTGLDVYSKNMRAAETSFSKKMYDVAEKQYKAALDINPNSEKAQLGLAKTYSAEENYRAAIPLYKNLLQVSTNKEEIALLLANSLLSGGQYRETIDILSKVEQSEQIKNKILEVKSRYSLKYIGITTPKSWQVVTPLDLESCTVVENEGFTTYSSLGKRMIHGKLSFVGPISEDKILYPAVEDGEWCYVNDKGNRQIVFDKKYTYLGPFYDGFAVASRDNLFGYIDKDGNEYLFSCSNAYNFQDGVAAIKQDGVIKYINKSFEVIKATDYDGIVADEYGFTAHANRQVLAKHGKYYFCDKNCGLVGNKCYEYVMLPRVSGEYVAYKEGGKYGFLNYDTGIPVITPQYDDARSFSNGLSPVKVEGKWGYIDANNNKVVDNTLKYATEISKEGTAFVQNEAGYALISFNYLQDKAKGG